VGEAGFKLDCGAGLGAATHITGAFAFAMAGRALQTLLDSSRAGLRRGPGPRLSI
jgi:tRNA A37 threonylcarbamoyladenosine dehydratase